MAIQNALNLTTTGLVSADGAGVFTGRTLTAPAAGVTVSNGNGVSGNPTLALANDLAAVEGLSTTGVAMRTSTDTWNTVDMATKGSLLAGDGTTDPRVLAVGSNDQILTAASGETTGMKWATSASLSSPLVLLSCVTASDDATIEFSSDIDSTYNVYFFVVDILPATDSVFLKMRTSTDGGSTYDSGSGDYSYAFATSGESGTSEAAVDAIRLGSSNGQSNVSGETLTALIHLINPSSTNYTKVHFNTGVSDPGNDGRTRPMIGTGNRKSAADVDAVQFFFSSGNIASGTICMYGMTTSS